MAWQKALEPDIEVCAVQLPGRGTRMGEKLYDAMPPLIADIAQVIKQQDQMPFAFFGHSLGGMVAFELARYCKQYYLPMPVGLFVSGCDAPQHRSPCKNLHKLPDDELIEALKDYNGTPPELLEHRELMELVLPTIRADFSIGETYRYLPSLPLQIPITVLAGKLDDHILHDEVIEWRKETTADCRVHWFEGDHFFINDEQKDVLDRLKVGLKDMLAVGTTTFATGTI
jgi:medium-chain acyl-[acyl-carrier-protein] hydrolase